MKTKHVLMIAAVLVAFFVMPGAVAADQSVVTYGIDSSYIVTIPHNIPLGTDTKAGEAPISLSEVFIYDGRTLEVSLDSANDKYLKLVGNEDIQLSYSMTVDGIDVEDDNGDAFLSVAHNDDDRAGAATIVFSITATEIPKAGIYTDTLTFTVEETGETDVLYIYTVEDLFAFAEAVNNGEDNFAGKTVVLWNDLDLGNVQWIPIGSKDKKFDGTFDGQGYTISNINIEGEGGLGLFGYVERDSVIKNVVVKNVKISGNHYAGAIVGHALSAIIDNCKAYNVDITLTPLYTGSEEDLKNGYDYGDKAGGIVGYTGDETDSVTNCYVEDVTITAYRGIGGIIGEGHGTISNNKVNGGSLIQDHLTNAYKEKVPATISEINGNSFGDTTMSGNTFSDVEIHIPFPTELETALQSSDATVNLEAGTYTTFPASSFADGVTLICEKGTVFTGNSKANINGATVIGATFSNPSGTAVDSTINGVFKDCTFTGSNGLRWCYAGENVVFENCVFDGSVYGVHFDGGANDVVFRGCTFSGFNAFPAAVTQLTFEDCTFVGNGKSIHNGANLWGNATMIRCEFTFDGSTTNEWIDCIGEDKVYEFKDCTVNSVAYTPENYADYSKLIFSRFDGDKTVKINENDCIF